MRPLCPIKLIYCLHSVQVAAFDHFPRAGGIAILFVDLRKTILYGLNTTNVHFDFLQILLHFHILKDGLLEVLAHFLDDAGLKM